MFYMSVGLLICDLKYRLLGDSSYSRDSKGYQKGLVVSVNLSLEYEPGGASRSDVVQFLFTGDTSVWMSKLERRWCKWSQIPIDEWENTSNHSSCWRSDGVEAPLTRLYFAWAKELIQAESYPDKTPSEMCQFCHFSLAEPWEFVLVKHEHDPTDKYRYKRKLIDIISMGGIT